jgi:hypothetical protein
MTHEMRRPTRASVPGLVLGLAALSLTACSGEVTPAVTAGVDSCANCNMVIDEVNQAAGWIQDGEFVTFDSPGCLLARYEALRKSARPLPEAETLYFADYRNGLFHPAAMATFLMTSHRPTVMGSGALVFGSEAAAAEVREHDDETVTDWIGYRTARGTPDRVVELTFGPDGLSPQRVEVEKDELVVWTVRNASEDTERTLSIKGYPELEPVRVAAGEEPTSFRLLATRPGAGFPIVAAGADEALGMLVVRGPHTADEEAEGT